MKKIVNTLILSGGGVKGISYIGALKYLDELKTKELELDRNKNEVSNLKQRVGALEKDNERLKFTVDETCKDYKKLRETLNNA